jgi:hypothetical protein
MFKRFPVHLALIFLFAFVQIGAVTHSISHANDDAKHNKTSHSQQDPSQQDKSSHSEQCEQCINFAKIAGGLTSQAFVLPVLQANSIGNLQLQTKASSESISAYSARAPPASTLI